MFLGKVTREPGGPDMAARVCQQSRLRGKIQFLGVQERLVDGRLLPVKE